MKIDDAEKAAAETKLDFDSEFLPTHRHTNGNTYEKLGVAMHTETGELLVIYCNPSGIVWARPKKMFEDGRFMRVNESSRHD